MIDRLWARPDSSRMTTDRLALQWTVWHLTLDILESHRACHKSRRQSPARPDDPDTILDRLVPLQTIRSPRSDCGCAYVDQDTARQTQSLCCTTPATHHSRIMPSPVHEAEMPSPAYEAECLSAPAKPEKI
jgi:hypothetical protein